MCKMNNFFYFTQPCINWCGWSYFSIFIGFVGVGFAAKFTNNYFLNFSWKAGESCHTWFWERYSWTMCKFSISDTIVLGAWKTIVKKYQGKAIVGMNWIFNLSPLLIYFCYYLWVIVYFLVLFMGYTVLFDIIYESHYTFWYNLWVSLNYPAFFLHFQQKNFSFN